MNDVIPNLSVHKLRYDYKCGTSLSFYFACRDCTVFCNRYPNRIPNKFSAAQTFAVPRKEDLRFRKASGARRLPFGQALAASFSFFYIGA